jgi:lysophospholipase L1-like esterase
VPSRLKAILLNGMLVVASIALFALAAEAFLRVFPRYVGEELTLRMHWGQTAVMGEGGSEAAKIDDPEIGFLYRPHLATRIGREGGFSFPFTTDEKGFRNPGPPVERAEIVVLGDSMAFGYGVGDDEGWVALLDRAVPQGRVVNLGLIGAAPQQYQRVYARFGRPLRPRLVIFTLFSGNDAADAEHFKLWDEAPRQVTFGEFKAGGGELHPQPTWWRRLINESYVLLALRSIRRSLRTSYQGHTHVFPDGQRVQLAPSVYLSVAERTQPGSPGFEAAMQALLATRDVAWADGADFLVVMIPAKEEVYLPLLGRPGPDLVAPYKAALAAEGVWQLDTTPALQARALDAPVYFEVDGHPNALGYTIIAEAVLRAMREREASDHPSS